VPTIVKPSAASKEMSSGSGRVRGAGESLEAPDSPAAAESAGAESLSERSADPVVAVGCCIVGSLAGPSAVFLQATSNSKMTTSAKLRPFKANLLVGKLAAAFGRIFEKTGSWAPNSDDQHDPAVWQSREYTWA
jgi:hypothetical protein